MAEDGHQITDKTAASDIPGANSALIDFVESFGRWHLASGFSRKTTLARKSALKALSAHWPSVATLPAANLPDAPGFAEAVEALPSWQAADARSLPRLLALMEEDRIEMSLKRKEFLFCEVNPGISALGFGAERADGRPVGATMVSQRALFPYESYHGAYSVRDPLVPPDILLVNLPFSAFVSHGNGDREVEAVLKEAARLARQVRSMLFRVDWTTGGRMGISPEEYVSAISRHLPGYELRHFTAANQHFIPMKGDELFIGASRQWTGPFRFVSWGDAPMPGSTFLMESVPHLGFASAPTRIKAVRFPQNVAERIDVDYLRDPRAAIVGEGSEARLLFPLEITSLLGFPPEFTLGVDEDAAYHLIGDSVAVPVAERAVRSLLRATGLE